MRNYCFLVDVKYIFCYVLINKINNWLAKGANGNLVVSYKSTKIIGRGISQGSTAFQDLTNASIVLKSNGNGGYDILTAYPNK